MSMDIGRMHLYTVTRAELANNFDEILEKIHNGCSSALIITAGEPDLLLFDWQDYWRRFSSLEPANEKARIEVECMRLWQDEQKAARRDTSAANLTD